MNKLINSVQELIEVSKNHKGKDWSRWYYRGHTKDTFKLIPKAGRPGYAAVDDQRMLRTWYRHAMPHLLYLGSSLNLWERLAIAQHHGLATRLLDWTFNPLVGAYFACVDSNGEIIEKEDGNLFAYYSAGEPVRFDENIDKINPFEQLGVCRLTPSSIVPRIANQGGIFTLHNPPTLDLADEITRNGNCGDQLEKYVIPGDMKQEISVHLSHLGVNRLALYPDLDGATAHVNWTFRYLPKPGESIIPK